MIGDEVAYGGPGISYGEIYCEHCYNYSFECCKCKKQKSYDDIGVKHSAGELECIDCYTKSIDKFAENR